MDTAFAKIVTDAYGVDHILIEGQLISLHAPAELNNELVDVIVRGLRSQGRGGIACGQMVPPLPPGYVLENVADG